MKILIGDGKYAVGVGRSDTGRLALLFVELHGEPLPKTGIIAEDRIKLAIEFTSLDKVRELRVIMDNLIEIGERP